MKRHLLALFSLSAMTLNAQVGIAPFDSGAPGYLGNFSSFSAGDTIPNVSLYEEEGDNLTGPINLWRADDGATVAPFLPSIGLFATGSCANGQEIILISPEMDFGTNTINPTLTLRYLLDNGPSIGAPAGFIGTPNFEVLYKESAAGPWVSLATYTNVNNTWTNVTIDLSGASSYSTYYLGFRHYTIAPGGIANESYMGLDEIAVEGTPDSCTPTSSAFNLTGCDGVVSPSGLYLWAADGVYNDTIPNFEGCDSVMVITVDISTVDNGTSVAGYSITADQAGGTYQWLDCNNAFAIVPGATSQTFNPAVDGDYAVSVTANGCTDTSGCSNISGLGLGNFEQNGIALYPNPTTGDVTISLGNNFVNTSIVIYAADGKLVERKHANAPLMSFSLVGDKGIYFVNIISEDRTTVVKVVKN